MIHLKSHHDSLLFFSSVFFIHFNIISIVFLNIFQDFHYYYMDHHDLNSMIHINYKNLMKTSLHMSSYVSGGVRLWDVLQPRRVWLRVIGICPTISGEFGDHDRAIHVCGEITPRLQSAVLRAKVRKKIRAFKLCTGVE